MEEEVPARHYVRFVVLSNELQNPKYGRIGAEANYNP